MAKGYSVGIVSETKAFRQGIETGVIRPLEDGQDALRDLGRERGADDAARSIDKLGDKAEDTAREVSDVADEVKDLGRQTGTDKLEDGMRDAQRATERLGDETEQVARDIERDFRDTYRNVKRGAEDASDAGADGFGRVREGAQEVTSEIGSNLGEAVSSIRGDLGDLAQVGQDTLGGLAATLSSTGPAGIAGAAALAAGAVGLGLITAELEKQQEEAERVRERLGSAYADAAQEGRDYLDVAQQVSEANDLMFNADRAEEWKNLQADAKTLGMDINDVIRANAGDLDQQAAVQERINKLVELNTGITMTADGAVQKVDDSVAAMASRWSTVTKETEEARKKAAQLKNFTTELHKSERDQIARTNAASTARYEGQAERYKKPIKMKFEVDDSAVRNYRPPTKTGSVRYDMTIRRSIL